MNCYLVFILTILIGTYFLELIIEWLNIKNLSPDLPEEFINFYDKEKYKQSQEYLKETTVCFQINKTFFALLTLFFIIYNGFNYVDIFARSFNHGDIVTGLIFTGTLVFGYEFLEMPFAVYETFILEKKYGFNTTTIKTFIFDIIKSSILLIIMGSIVYSGVLWFFGYFKEFAWLYSWIAVTLFQIIVVFLAPVIIMPLFNKFTPLEDSELKKAVEEYAKSQDFKMKGLFKMDGSKRSTKSNAYFTGFGKFRRIVLFDTLIEKHTVPELVAVLAHEMGHYKKKHISKSIFVSIATSFFLFWLLSFFISNRELFDAFGMEKISVYAGLVFFGFIFTPISMVLSIIGNIISRNHEFESDAYVIHSGNKAEDFINALKKLCVDNLSNLTPHPLMVLLKYSHPPILDRINKIREISKESA